MAEMNVKPEFKKEILQFLKGLIDKSRTEKGNIQYNLHQSSTNPNELTFIEIWASQDAVNTHAQSAHFREFEPFVKDKVNAMSIKLMQQIM